MTRPTVKVAPRIATKDMLVYARAGEKTYCAGGHEIGHFKTDAMVGQVAGPDSLQAIPPVCFGDAICPFCFMPLVAGHGIYYFEVKP